MENEVESKKTDEKEIEDVEHKENETESDGEQVNTQTRNARKSSIRRPENKRRIQFKKDGSSLWYEGEVTRVGDMKENDKFICDIQLDNNDVVKVDFGDRYLWRNKRSKCYICNKEFENLKGRNRQVKKLP